MLEPRTRAVYLESLKPPPGYRLDRAIGTTYSVDLLSLLSVPLAFAQLDWAERRDELLVDPVRLLRALREEAERVTLFCQAGRIGVPSRGHPLFAHLEPMLVESAVRGARGEFHPKTWILRFTSGPDVPVLYRFLCLSRNLTTDTSWDTVLALEGPLESRTNAFGRNHPLGDFVEALPGLATHEVAKSIQDDVARISHEIRRVRFAPPEGFEDEITFAPLGIDGHRRLDLDQKGADRLVIISPFLTPDFVRKAATARENVLVSRQESLDALPSDALGGYEKVFVLDEDPFLSANGGNEDASVPAIEERSGLHAKLYVVDSGWNATVWTGSANASDPGFERNVEFMVGLYGKKSRVGARTLLGESGEGDAFRSVLLEYRPPEVPTVMDPAARTNENLVDEARRILVRAGLALAVESDGNGFHALRLNAPGTMKVPEGVRVRAWPVTLPAERAEELADGSLVFRPLSSTQITAFACFDVRAGEGEQACAARFTLLLPLAGAPPDRLEELLATLLEDPQQFLRLLLMLLTDQELDPAAAADLFVPRRSLPWEGAAARDLSGIPLLEDLVRTVARNPERLEAVNTLVEDLKRTPKGLSLLPPGFEAIWDAVWAAREKR